MLEGQLCLSSRRRLAHIPLETALIAGKGKDMASGALGTSLLLLIAHAVVSIFQPSPIQESRLWVLLTSRCHASSGPRL